MSRYSWLSVSYNVPIQPSKNRVYIWRKLKEMGAEYLKHGVAVLPNTHRNLQNIRTLAAKIKAMGGESCLTELRFLGEEDELQLIAAFKRQSSDEFRELLLDIARFYEGVSVGDPRKEQLAIRRRYAKARERDFFGAEEELDLEGGISELIADVKQGSRDLTRWLRQFLPESK